MARQVLTLPDVPAALLTEAEASTTYLTQANAAATYLPLSHAPGTDPHPQYLNNTRGDLRYSLLAHNHDASYSLTSHNHNAAYVDVAGDDMAGNLAVGGTRSAWVGRPAVQVGLRGALQGSSAGSYTALSSNSYYDGVDKAMTGGVAVRATLSGGVFNVGTAPSVATNVAQTWTDRLTVDNTGIVGVGVTPAAWDVNWRALQVGRLGSLSSAETVPWTQLSNNSFSTAANANALITGPASRLAFDGGAVSLENAPSVAAGAAQVFTPRLAVDAAGRVGVGAGLTLPPHGHVAVQVGDGMSVLGNALGSAIGGFIATCYYNAGWKSMRAYGRPAYLYFVGDGGLDYSIATGTASAANQALSMTSVFNIGADGSATHTSQTGYTLTLTSSTDGHSPSLLFNHQGNNARTYRVGAFGNAAAGYFFIRDEAAGGDRLTYNPSTGYWGFVGHPLPGTDNTYYCGLSGNRWIAVYAVNGAIQTSVASMKEDFGPLDPAACAQAVLETDWVEFRYLPPQPPDDAEGLFKASYLKQVQDTAHTRHQKGYVLKSPAHKTHALFGLDDRESTSVASDLAVVASALSGALKRIATLETHILQLEAAR